MDEISSELAAPHSPAPMKPLWRAALAFLGMVGVGALLVWMNGGKPISVWFYPYVLVLACIGAFRMYRDKTRGQVGPVAGESKRRSAELAVLEGAVLGISAYVLYALSTADRGFRSTSLAIAVFLPYAVYCRRRGQKPSHKVSALLMLALLAWFVVYLEVSRRFF